MRLITYMTPKTHKYDNVAWLKDGQHRGKGYRMKGQHHICLIKCPICNYENVAANVNRGLCSWCPFDANEEK